MKVLMINKFLYPAGGAETYLLEVGNYWKKRGAEVEYFGMGHADNVVGNRWGVYADYANFRGKGIFANVRNPIKIIYSHDAAKKVRYILEKFKPDVMHLNNFNYQLTPSILEAAEEYRSMGQKLRIVYTAHDSQLVCPNHYLYNPVSRRVCERCLTEGYKACIYTRCIHGSIAKSCLGTMEAIYWKRKKVYKNIDVIICPSDFMKEKLNVNPILAPKTIVLRNFVRPIENKRHMEGRYVLYFGRFSEEKGIKTLLDACRKLKNIPFVFAGSGPLEPLIAGIDNVRNVGFLKDEELDQVIQGARFSVCPSECNENCPFSVIESIINGTPVLGAQRGGIPELIIENRTGWLFEADDKNALASAIQKIWDSEEPERFSEACQKEQFDTMEEYGKKLERIYNFEI